MTDHKHDIGATITAELAAAFASLVTIVGETIHEIMDYNASMRAQCDRVIHALLVQQFQGHTRKARSRKAERRMRRKWHR